MSSIPLRISVNGPDFPFLFRDASRATIIPNLDQIPRWGRSSDSNDWNMPQLLYAENVLPIAKGLLSTQFQSIIPNTVDDDFDQAVILRDAAENNTLLVPGRGKNYILNLGTGGWTSSLPFTFTHKLFTRGYTQGRSFVFYEKEKLFEYDGTTNALVNKNASLVLPAGYAVTDIRGIGAASNYLLLFTDVEVLWSSPTDPLNFNFALNNGSGKQIPNDVKGAISAILPVAGGAIIYTVRNAVAAFYTNNAATPFAFKGITNSGGVASYEQVAYDSDELYQYVWGSGGLQQVSLQRAEGWMPEVTDMLTSGRYETYDYATHEVVSDIVANYMAVKMTYVSQRFLVVSYGPTPDTYTYALIYDAVLKRWGKVKMDHVDCFTYPYPGITGDLSYGDLFSDYSGLGDATYLDLGVGILSINPPKKAIAFLNANGGIQILVADYATREQQGVVLIGQIQHNRSNFTTLHEVELEGVDPGSSPKLFALVSVDGKTNNRSVEYICYEQTGEYRMHYGDEVGKNISLALEGGFQLTGLLARVAKHGRY